MNITDEAIDAAMKAIKFALQADEGVRRIAKEALEAAAPYMLAEPWVEGFTDAYYQERGYDLDGRQAYVLPDSLVEDAKAWNRYRPTA